MSTEAGGRITLLIALACWIVPVFGAGIAFIGWGWWRWWRDWSPERQRQLQSEAQVWLDGAVAGLTPWRPAALGDLSTDLSDHYVEFASFTARGTVDSRAGDARWIAFSLVQNSALDEERRSSVVLARTTRHHWRMDLRRGAFAIALDGRPFGWWRHAEGDLTDAAGRRVGGAPRPGGRLTLGSGPAGWESWHGRSYPVALHGRPAGTISTQAVLGYLFQGERLVPLDEPLIAPTNPAPDEESALWLLALGIIEAAYFSFNQPYLKFGGSR